MIVKLRKLTFKSIIGFGNYKDLTVHDLCALLRHRELIQIYYNLGNIDFSDEVKAELCINERRSIKKPGIDKTAYKFFHGEILHDIIDRNKERCGNDGKNFLSKMASVNKKDAVRASYVHDATVNSKMRNRNRIQKYAA